MNDNSPTGRRPEPPEMQTLHKRTLARPGLLEVDFAELELRAMAAMSEFDWKAFQRSLLS